MTHPRFYRVRVALVFGALFSTACSDAAERLTAVSPSSASAAARAAEDVRAAIAAQERHTPALMRMRGVVGTAVGILPNGRAGVQVFVIDGTTTGMPETLDNVPVQIRVTGMMVALSDPRLRLRPSPVGYSVGHPLITAGTIGARVVNPSGAVYILSNNHVLANSNDASIGDPILQPGPFDGGKASDQIATLAAFRPIDFAGGSNPMDAAIALSTAANLDNATPVDDGYGLPNGTIFGDADDNGVFDNKTQLLNLNVQKYGRTTKLTRGRITGINATIDICYEVLIIFCVKSARFTDQLVIGQSGFSGGGDSGSLIVTDNAEKNPVALLFAGNNTQTIANRIDLVLNHFGVSVDGTASEPPPPPDPVSDAGMILVNALSSFEQGRTLFVGALVRNLGNQPLGAFDVTMVDETDGVTIGTSTVTQLAVGASESVVFSWNTSTSSVGPHVLVATLDLADDNPGNNSATKTVLMTAPAAPFTDAAVTAINAPASVALGATAGIGVVVQNVGNQSVGAFDVSLTDQTDAVTIGTQTVPQLAAGASVTLTFPWNTASSSLGAHTLVAAHGLSDENGANDQATANVQVNEVDLTQIHVGNMDGWSQGDQSWSATVELTIHDANHLPLNGATIVGSWSISGLNADTCTSGDLGGNGTCIVFFPSLKKGTKSVTFTVTSVTMAGRTYHQSQNHDPDGSSNGTSQAVARP